MNITLDDLTVELEDYRRNDFNFYVKLLVESNNERLGDSQIIYGELEAIKKYDIKDHVIIHEEYQPFIHYWSFYIDAKKIRTFLENCWQYHEIQHLKHKEKCELEDISHHLSYLKLDAEEIKHFYNEDLAISNLNSVKIILKNLNYTSDVKKIPSNPIDFSIDKDSTTDYFQIDFSSHKKKLDLYKELINLSGDYYHTIYDLIFDKFGVNFQGDGSILKHSLVIILPKEHIGKVDLELIDQKLKAKIVNVDCEKLFLKLQIKKNNPLRIEHYNIQFDKNKTEREITLKFKPDIIRGWLIDKQYTYIYRIQKIVKTFNNLEPFLISKEKLKQRILDGESQTTEFKRKYPMKNNSLDDLKILKTICAFANTEGGLIIFGVNDEDAKIVGFEVSEQFPSFDAFERHIQTLCYEKINPPVIAQVVPLKTNGKQLIIVQIDEYKKGNYVQVKNHNLFMVRRGSTNRVATPDEVKRDMNST